MPKNLILNGTVYNGIRTISVPTTDGDMETFYSLSDSYSGKIFTVSFTGSTDITYSNKDTKVKALDEYLCNILPSTGHYISSISVTINGENHPAYVINRLTHAEINIPKVMNDVVINVATEAVSNILYDLRKPVYFDGTNYINTGIQLLKADSPFTILYESELTYKPEPLPDYQDRFATNNMQLLFCMSTTRPWPGLGVEYNIGYRPIETSDPTGDTVGNYSRITVTMNDNNNDTHPYPDYPDIMGRTELAYVDITEGLDFDYRQGRKVIALVYSPANKHISIYVNGRSVGNTMDMSAFYPITNTLFLGAAVDGNDIASKFFKGYLHSMVILDTDITSQEALAATLV